MLTAEQREQKAPVIAATLEQFSGTEGYHRLSPLHRGLVVTDGVKYLCEEAGAYWLVDIIASYQPKCMRDPMLRHMQFWTLQVDQEKRTAVVTCERDGDDVAITQRIGWSDFPLPEVKVWVEAADEGLWVAMLPRER